MFHWRYDSKGKETLYKTVEKYTEKRKKKMKETDITKWVTTPNSLDRDEPSYQDNYTLKNEKNCFGKEEWKYTGRDGFGKRRIINDKIIPQMSRSVISGTLYIFIRLNK